MEKISSKNSGRVRIAHTAASATVTKQIAPSVKPFDAGVGPLTMEKTVTEKKEKRDKKDRKDKKDKKDRKNATVTSGDGRHGTPSLGPQNAILIPDNTGDIDKAVFDTAIFERGLVSPLPLTPVRAEYQLPVRQAYPEIPPISRVTLPPDDWRAEMRKEMRALMKESLKDLLPGVLPSTGSNQDSSRSQVNRPLGPGVALPQSPIASVRPFPSASQAFGPSESGVVSPQAPLASIPRGAVVLEGAYKATKVSPCIQRQVPGAMLAPVGSVDQFRVVNTVPTPFMGSSSGPATAGLEVTFPANVLADESDAEDVDQQQDNDYNPFQGRDGLEGCSLTGLGSALSRQRTVVTPSTRQLALWRQVRGGNSMEPVRVEIVERLYSGDVRAKPFLDPEPPMEVQMTAKQQLADGALRKQQRDMGLIAHALTTGLEDLERASNHLMRACDDMFDEDAKNRVLEAHKEMTQAATHPLGHALRLLASRFNDLSQKRRNHLAGSTADKVLAQQIKQTPLGFDSLLDASLQPAIDASATRRQQDLLSAALRNNVRQPRRERSRSPVRRDSQQHQPRSSYQPFRQGSRGDRGSRGSRGQRGGSRGTRGRRPFSRRS